MDLFGNPVRERTGKRGRPALQVTAEMTNKVKMLLALGWANQLVADAIQVSLPTLKRHFRVALADRDKMRVRMEAARIYAVAEKALAGDVGAGRLFQQLLDRNDRNMAEMRLAERGGKDQRGKKDISRDLALSAETALDAELEQEVLNLGRRN